MGARQRGHVAAVLRSHLPRHPIPMSSEVKCHVTHAHLKSGAASWLESSQVKSCGRRGPRHMHMH
jgi:hypothetical protein